MNYVNQSKQTLALCWVNIKSFPKRIVSSLVTMFSIACVSAVFLSVLTMTDGMMRTVERTGHENTVLVMRAGAVSELQSVMFPMEVNLLKDHHQILRDSNGQAIVSAEMFVNTEYKFSGSGDPGDNVETHSLGIRGISPATYRFRPNFQLVAGRQFNTGVRELIIGRAIARRMPEITLNSTIVLGGVPWKVTGIFADHNSVFESEIWADIGVLQSDYQRGPSVQSVRLALGPDTKLAELASEWHADPRLNIRIIGEQQFFAEQGKNLTRLVRWIGLPVALIMSIGALFAALNTMYAVIAARSKEIATQKAIGFSPVAISFSIVIEAILLAVIGASFGVLSLYLVFDGWTAATQDASNLSQIMFNFDISFKLIMQTLFFAVVIGVIGGIIPAIRAVKLPVTKGLRDI